MLLAIIPTIIFSYLFTQFVGYWVHRMLHSKYMGHLYCSHKVHHEELYPSNDYLSDVYRKVPMKDNPIFYYGFVALISSITFFAILPISIAFTLTSVLVLTALANDWLHVQLHIKNHWLERFEWFWTLRELHHLHHEDDSKNIGIFSWFTDKMMRTYKNPNDGKIRFRY